MTREKAINEYIIPALKNTWNEKKCEEVLKALEQEPVLDKIRAEINTPNRGTCDYFIVDRIEEIIDKYRESEET